jgi:glycosyltransferase involved in cell wall biosynthesis
VVVNSKVTHDHVREVGVPEDRIRTIYYGINPDEFRPIQPDERQQARERLAWGTRPTAIFLGALGHDRRKGFDVLFEAWALLAQDPAWDVDLAAVGGGADVPHWQAEAQRRGLAERIRMLGFSKQVPDILAAADLLISPTYYEAYGLGVHEALCRGLPALVTRSAGVAERYPSDMTELLLADPPTPADLAARLRHWRANLEEYRRRVVPFAESLRTRSWGDMARDIVAQVAPLPESASQ